MKNPELLPYSAALDMVFKHVPLMGTERVALRDCVGRSLREPVRADRPLPPFHRSAMDGYALKCSDLKNGVAMLRCIGVLEAGSIWKGRLKKGQTVKIMTGAPLPDGADTVVMVEKSKPAGNMVELHESGGEKWLNVHRKAADAKKGQTLLRAGMLLDPFGAAVAASVGAVRILVSRRIKTCVISTGSEILPPNRNPRKPFQIRDANSSHLLARLAGIGLVDASFGGLIPDDPAAFKKTVSQAINQNNVVILSGGISMGDADFATQTLQEMAITKIFHKCAIRPGKPLWFGLKNGTVVFNLPGNPVSAAVTFHEFVLPAIRKMAGLENPSVRAVSLPLAADASKKHRLREFRVARISSNSQSIEPVEGYKGSGDFVSASQSGGVMVIPEGEQTLKAGRIIEFHPWNL